MQYLNEFSLAFVLLIISTVACTADGEPKNKRYSVAEAQDLSNAEEEMITIKPALASEKERRNLSGSACSPSGQCLFISDEMRFARYFTLKGGALVPGQEVFLLPKTDDRGKKTKESDGEGVAFADGYFYVIGSHSNSKSAEVQLSRHFLARFSVDAKSGFPSDFGAEDRPSAALELTNLDYLLQEDPFLKEHLQEAAGEFRPGDKNSFTKDQHGVNIEAIAVRGGRTYIGFRGPLSEKGALVWDLPTDELFLGKTPKPVAHYLPLGSVDEVRKQGIRDFASVSDGLLILAGPEMRSRYETAADGTSGRCLRACPAPALFLWRGGAVKPIALKLELGDLGGDSPEAITVIAEEADHYRLLVLADGDSESAPRVTRVSKPD